MAKQLWYFLNFSILKLSAFKLSDFVTYMVAYQFWLHLIIKRCLTQDIHQMETFSALLAFSMGNSPVTGESPAQRPVTRSFDVFFDLRLDWQLSKQWIRWWFETPSRPLWRHCNGLGSYLSCWSFFSWERILWLRLVVWISLTPSRLMTPPYRSWIWR